MSTLADIRLKVRRLTGRPSPQQITDEEIDEYVNTFYLYDMPDSLRLFSQETIFEFMTTANVDQYNLRELTYWTGVSNEFVVDVFPTLKPPGYIAGYQSFWSQDREQFFRTYPALAEISETVEGDGSTGPYTLTFANTPVLQYQVTAGAIDSTGATINAIDVPTNRQDGTWQIINSNTVVAGSIDYITGSLSITFTNPIPAGNRITFTAVPYQPNRPQAILYYDDVITLRPVPDREYLIQVDAYQRPSVFLTDQSTMNPQIKQWWQYLAYGASKKIFEESQDPEGRAAIMDGYREQERMVLRRTIVQRTNERTATIYTEMTQFPYGNFNNRF